MRRLFVRAPCRLADRAANAATWITASIAACTASFVCVRESGSSISVMGRRDHDNETQNNRTDHFYVRSDIFILPRQR